jgi:hypothetical protein
MNILLHTLNNNNNINTVLHFLMKNKQQHHTYRYRISRIVPPISSTHKNMELCCLSSQGRKRMSEVGEGEKMWRMGRKRGVEAFCGEVVA